jgi:hypothetical protein
VRRARDDARALISQETPPAPPTDPDLRSAACRAIYARLLAERQAQEADEQDAALAALVGVR